jgi:hypothetical protein
MIDYWKKSCEKNNCNHMSVEYPEFAQKGMYQKAINFKPSFIREALQACHPRSVLYIDGDMHIKKYPHIFDMSNIDFASQGWNADPRTSMSDINDPVCYYPYVFETSGGTMFYANTSQSYNLLQRWREITNKFPLKADDRLLSKTFNLNKMMVPIRYIPLPMEYLWLSDDYNGIDKRLSTRRNIFIEHPECLTGEDRAAAEGASTQRVPPRYEYEITNKVVCRGRGMLFWEYVFFSKKSEIASLQQWLKVLDERNLLDVVPYNQKYGKRFNDVANNNVALSKKVKVNTSDSIVMMNTFTPHLVLAHLRKGVNVIISPKGSKLSSIKKAMNDEYELICYNINNVEKRYKKVYTLKVDTSKPMFLRASSKVLRHLVTMSKNKSDFQRIFNLSFIFLSRISCKWI